MLANEAGVRGYDVFTSARHRQTRPLAIAPRRVSRRGKAGSIGPAGHDTELAIDAGWIKWRETGEALWHNLIALSALQGPQGNQGNQGIQGLPGDTRVKYCKRGLTTDAAGVGMFTLPQTGLSLFIQPRSAGEFLNTIVLAGTPAVNATITFKKFKPAGLAITIPTLLTVSIFEAAPGIVSYDVLGVEPF